MNENERAKSSLAASHKDSGAPTAAQASSPNPIPGQRRTLLVVEDDPDTQAFMKALLGRYYDVVSAASEEEFWAVLDRLTPCIILMDVTLKGSQDGLTLTRQFRAVYVSKPVDRRRLLALIRSLVPDDPAPLPD
jgi:PleD family two-component response regulator